MDSENRIDLRTTRKELLEVSEDPGEADHRRREEAAENDARRKREFVELVGKQIRSGSLWLFGLGVAFVFVWKVAGLLQQANATDTKIVIGAAGTAIGALLRHLYGWKG